MRIITFFLLLILAGCSSKPPQEAVAGRAHDTFVFQVPGSWENKDGNWYEGRKLRLQVFEGQIDPRRSMADKMGTALKLLDTSGPYSTSQFLYRLHQISFNPIPPDRAEFDALWKQVEDARDLLPGTIEEKPDSTRVEAARALLQTTQQGYKRLYGDFPSRARRFGNAMTGNSYNFAKAESTPMTVDGRPALFLSTESSGRRQDIGYIGFLVFEAGHGLAGLALYSEKPMEVNEGNVLAASVRFGVRRSPNALRTKKRAKPLTQRLPKGLLFGLAVLGAASLPAAFGAASGYGPSNGSGVEPGTGAGAGAFFFAGVGMLFGICVLLVILFSGILEAPTSGRGLMVGFGLLIYLCILGTLASISWVLTCWLASLGARVGARQGRFTAALGAGVLAGLGALMVPGLLVWLC